MKKVWIKFEIEDVYDENDLQMALKANSAFLALHEIWEKVFRPAYKHGYQNSDLEKLCEDLPEDKDGKDIIDHLAAIYREILEEHNVNPDDYLT